MIEAEFCMLPYASLDGIRTYRDSEILELYERLLNEGGEHVFRDGSVKSAVDFLCMAKGPQVAFYVAYVRGVVAGVVWLNRFQARFAQCSFFVFRQFWGADALGLGRHCLRELLHARDAEGRHHLDMLIGLTPADNRAAISFALRCGWKRRGLLPYGIYNAAAGISSPAVLTTATRDAAPQGAQEEGT